MERTVDRLPTYLQKYCVTQDYDAYTPREHATWRCIMRQNKKYFAKSAVAVYLEGLDKTGIPIERIPNIEEMDQKLREFGYGAVGVVGFIPPAIFLEFQSLGIMPIATDIRTLEHIGYTPAPDIVHEAAGHVPVVADQDYRDYLKLYGNIANKSLTSVEDIRKYEAVRKLSDIKENPDTQPGEIEEAMRELDLASQAISFTSESSKVGRMGWWTIEYGLVGEKDDLKIYGAGLLSSVTEAQNCLNDKVQKIPLTVDCVDQDFDITEQQPQLYIVPTLADLKQSLIDLQNTLSFVRGGVFGCEEAQRCRTVNTIELDNGLQFCGVVTEIESAKGQEQPDFVKVQGPTQLCLAEKVLPGHDKSAHQDGFSTPLGHWKGVSKNPSQLSDKELSELSLVEGQASKIEFVNGFVVEGVLTNVMRQDGSIILLSWKDATVTRGEKTYFEPTWGPFDMPVATRVTSVFAGPGDRDAFGEYDIGFASTNPGRQSPYSDQEKAQFAYYQSIRALRETDDKEVIVDQIEALAQKALSEESVIGDEWLIYLELCEVADIRHPTYFYDLPWADEMVGRIKAIRDRQENSDTRALIDRALMLDSGK